MLIALLLTIQAHAFSRGAPSPSPSPRVTALPVLMPVAGPHPKLVLKGTVNAGASEVVRLEAALAEANRRLGTQCFRDRVIAATMTETTGLSPGGVYALISKAPSELSVEIFNGSFWDNYWNRTIAFEGTGSQIRLNRHFLGTAESIGATYVHERLGHGYGFTHYGSKASSVPYQLQYALEACH